MEPIKRPIITQKTVGGCYVKGHFFLNETEPLSTCESCRFFGGMDDENVLCHSNFVTFGTNTHVTEFTDSGYLYKARRATEEEHQLVDNYDYCPLCCFHEITPNGSEICLLRESDLGDGFICYEGEIWEKTKLEE
jgi:hypothetical protein